MGAGANIDDEDGMNEINVTPLVDVMLVLLIIFLVASIYIVKESIEVELPKAASATEVKDNTLAIVVDKNGSLYLNGNPSDENAIAKACQALVAKDANSQAIISADQDTKHGNVVNVIDLIRENGLVRFAINVKVPDTGK